MSAAVDRATSLHTMPKNAALAVCARGRQRLNCALEAVKHMRFPRQRHLKRLVIVVATHFTLCHRDSFVFFGHAKAVLSPDECTKSPHPFTFPSKRDISITRTPHDPRSHTS